MTLKVLDLFSGIGGFSLGLERTGGFQTEAFCEIDQKAQAVLRKNWPDVPIYSDVKEIDGRDFTVDLVCGGFPCQDISKIGRGAGLSGERSGLWWEFHRIIDQAKPSWVIIENSPVLRSRGLDQILRSLAEIGYDAEWHCLPASAIGAPHQRDRLWIVAYPMFTRLEGHAWNVQDGAEQPQQDRPASPQGLLRGEHPEGWWSSEPDVGRVANGIPGRVDRLKQLGNAVVPQIPEIIGRAILQTITQR